MALLAQRYPTAKVVAVSVFLWSIVVMTTAACMNYAGLMLNRFFLGVTEPAWPPSSPWTSRSGGRAASSLTAAPVVRHDGSWHRPDAAHLVRHRSHPRRRLWHPQPGSTCT